MFTRAMHSRHDGAFDSFHAWLDLVQMAAFADYTWRGSVSLVVGETPPASLTFLATRWGWTVKRARTWLAERHAEGTLRAGQQARDGQTYHIVDYAAYTLQGHALGTAKGMQEAGNRARSGHGEGTKEKTEKSKKSENHHPPSGDDIARAWDAYPREGRARSSRAETARQWSARLKEGHTAEEMLEGLSRYVAFLEATPDYPAMGAQRFFGAKCEFLNEWTVPAEGGRPHLRVVEGGADRRRMTPEQRAQEEAFDAWDCFEANSVEIM
jgi:hypothetical protein